MAEILGLPDQIVSMQMNSQLNSHETKLHILNERKTDFCLFKKIHVYLQLCKEKKSCIV